jgi:serine phosphatase RsbU (regulator of sigma subunit)/putative methionine-R-sulfoxide reductase with GAF domain
MKATRRTIKPSAWQQFVNEGANVGERLLSARSLEAQRDQIIAVTNRLIDGGVQVWLHEDLFRLPDWDSDRLFPTQPPTEGMRRAVKNRKLIQLSSAGKKLKKVFSVCLPLVEQGFMLGALQISRARGPRFQPDELELLEALANILSIGLLAVHRVEVERFRRGQLNLVRDVSAQIASVLDVDELSSRVTRLIQKSFNYYYVAIFTQKPNSRFMRFRSSASTSRKGKKQPDPAIEVEIGQGLIGEAAASGEQIISADVRLDPRFRFLGSLPETRSEVVLPLKIEGRVLGVLDVQSNKPNSFHPNDLLILGALADNIARAIESARVYSDLRRRADQLSLVADVSKSVTVSLNLSQLLSEVAARIQNRFGYDQVSLFTVHPNRRLIVYEAGAGRRTRELQGFTMSLDLATGIIPQVGRSGEAILANNLKLAEHQDPTPLIRSNSRSQLTVPLAFNERVVGVLDIQSARRNAFSEDDRLMFEAVADTLAAAIRNADLYQSELWRRQVSDSLREVAGLLSEHAGVDQVLESILVELERNLPVDLAAIWLVRDGGLQLVAVHGMESQKVEDGYRLSPEAASRLQQALISEVPLIRQPGDVFLPSTLAAGFHEQHSALMVPMRLEEQHIGLITLFHHTASRYGHEAQLMATTFASYAAVAIENARLYDSAQEQAYASAALLQAARAVVSSNDLDEVLETVLRIMPILLGVQKVALFTRDPSGERYSCRHHYGFDEQEALKWTDRTIEPGSLPILEMAVKQGRLIAHPLNSSSRSDDWLDFIPEDMTEYEIKSAPRLLLAVPVVIKNDPFGVLLLEESGKGRRYRTRQNEIITGMAQQMALAIQNDRLQQSIVARERLETEATLARQIQQTFIPETLPSRPGWDFAARWLTAREVGGDFYDVIQLTEQKIGLFIADVADKGMPAALFMALTRTLMRAAILEADFPEEVIRRVNKLLLPDTRQGMFITLFYAVLDLESSEFTYVNAGHNPPIWIRSNNKMERLTRTAIALGLMEDPKVEQSVIRMEAGDRLFMYTDGVTEAISPSGEFFGEESLQLVLVSNHTDSARGLLEKVEKHIDDFTGSQPLADDMTMLAIFKS